MYLSEEIEKQSQIHTRHCARTERIDRVFKVNHEVSDVENMELTKDIRNRLIQRFERA